MKLKLTYILPMLLVGLMSLVNPVRALALPHFTLNPTSGNETVGQNFTVVIGIDSDTEKVVGVDIKTSYDNTKLDVVSIEKGTVPDDGYVFSYSPGQAIIHSDTGIIEATLTPLNQSVLEGKVAKHELLKVTFKPKATGTATFTYTCTAGSVVESNIISQAGVDVVDCSTNQSGSYVITAGVGGEPTNTPTMTPTSAPGSTATPVPTGTSALPQTGGVENTLALLILGISSIGAALYFKLV